MAAKKPSKETNSAVLRQAMLKRLPRRTGGSGEISLPAAPALLEQYVQTLGTLFTCLGRVFSAAELDRVREILKNKLDEGFKASPYAKIIVSYRTDPPPSTALSYTVSHAVITIADEYKAWVETRTPPLFGAHPDAKVMALAHSLGVPAEVPVLDIGAGTGRNTLPLAKEGFPTDAVELAPALAEVLRQEVATQNVQARVFEGDALDPSLGLPTRHYRLIVLAEVVASHFRDVDHVRRLFECACEWLAPGGLLVFSAFLTSSGYKPDDLARQLSEVFWCTLFTRGQFDEVAAGLPLARVSDESTFHFEHENLPETAWPPTGWFTQWTQGQDLFDLPADKVPMELRWLVYRRDG